MTYRIDSSYPLRIGSRTVDAYLGSKDLIAVYGDSFVFGHGVEHHESFSELLNLEQKTINCGVFGYGPDQGFA